MNRITLAASLAALALGCQPDPPPVAHPGALMASAQPAAAPVTVPTVTDEAPEGASSESSDAIDGTHAIAEIPSASSAPAAPVVPTRLSHGSTGGSTASAVEGVDLSCPPGRRTIASESGWAGGPGYDGTGHPDPEPLKAISDSEMLALAGDAGRADPDREHALVSVGRRKVPGAIDAFRRSLETSQPLAIREMALSGLMEHGGPQALGLIKQVFTDDPSSQLRGMAIWGVALYGASEAHPVILEALEDPSAEVHGMAMLATWALKDRPELAWPILEAGAISSAQQVWQEAFGVLSRMPYSDAGNMLERLVRSSKASKQQMAMASYRTWRQRFPELCK